MRSSLSAVLIFFLSLCARPAAAAMWFEPPDATTQTAVFLNVAQAWSDSCVPRNATVTKNGDTIDVLWHEPAGAGCLQAVTAWRDSVFLGILEAGVYTVVPRIALRTGEIATLASRTLTVREAVLPYQLVPRYLTIAGGEVAFGDDRLCGDEAHDVSVSIDGVEVPSRYTNCWIHATVPPHAAGAVDLTIRVDGVAQTFRASLRYVDPNAAPDPAVVERILVPLLYDGPGAYGSSWTTRATVTNRNQERFEWYPCTGSCASGIGSLETASLMTMFGNRPSGLLLFADRQSPVNDLHFGSVIRDVTNARSWGTEIPIVREKNFRTGYTLLPGVIFGPRYRALLRIYGVDGVLERIFVDVQAAHSNSQSLFIERVPSACAEAPCKGDQPAYIAVDLTSVFANYAQANPGVVNVSVRPNDGWNVQRYWAFVSVTDNETQNVTVITPQ